MPAYVPRRAEAWVWEAVGDTRVVLVTGARQVGKSTLLQRIGDRIGAERRTLDDETMRRAAQDDPAAFVDVPHPLIVDEVQRAPDLLLSIKAAVDRDPRPGRFLLSGSARVLGLRALPDTLVGRMETIELWPFSQGEIDGTADSFVDAAFGSDPAAWAGPVPDAGHPATRAGYAARLLRGGFPEVVARTSERARGRYLDAYLRDLVLRDVTQLREIERTDELHALLRLLAARSGQVLVAQALANELRISQPTVARYLRLLEEVFLIKRVPAWSRILSTRVTAAPKLVFVDSAIAANLLDVDQDALIRPGSVPWGGLLEGFVLAELARQLTWSRIRATLHHYRTRDGVEVDAVLEDRRGRVVALEVKSASTVRSEDFTGLRHLATRLGDDLVLGAVLYTGEHSLSFGPRMRALPIGRLWTATG